MKIPHIFVFLMIAAAADGAVGEAFTSNRDLPSPEENVSVAHVVDGDTIKLEDGRIVRLIGVDCPELYNENVNAMNAARLDMSMKEQDKYAVRAGDYLRELIGKDTVRLEYDPSYQVLKHQDRGGRVLAYIYNGEELANAELIKRGFCTVHPRLTFKMRREFNKYEEQARREKLGMWEKILS